MHATNLQTSQIVYHQNASAFIPIIMLINHDTSNPASANPFLN
jgi:hypothetical protein